jgi:hypothetical protein
MYRDYTPEQGVAMPRKNKKLQTNLVVTQATKVPTAAAAKASTAAAAPMTSQDQAVEAGKTLALTAGTTTAAITLVQTTVRGGTISTAHPRRTTTVCAETPEGGASKAAARTAVAAAAATDPLMNHRPSILETRLCEAQIQNRAQNQHCVFIKSPI